MSSEGEFGPLGPGFACLAATDSFSLGVTAHDRLFDPFLKEWFLLFLAISAAIYRTALISALAASARAVAMIDRLPSRTSPAANTPGMLVSRPALTFGSRTDRRCRPRLHRWIARHPAVRCSSKNFKLEPGGGHLMVDGLLLSPIGSATKSTVRRTPSTSQSTFRHETGSSSHGLQLEYSASQMVPPRKDGRTLLIAAVQAPGQPFRIATFDVSRFVGGTH